MILDKAVEEIYRLRRENEVLKSKLQWLLDNGDFFMTAIEASNPHSGDFEEFKKEIIEILK